MDQANILIIGGGVVGCAIAEASFAVSLSLRVAPCASFEARVAT